MSLGCIVAPSSKVEVRLTKGGTDGLTDGRTDRVTKGGEFKSCSMQLKIASCKFGRIAQKTS